MRNRVKGLREELGMNQTELAEALKNPVSRQTIANIERGKYTPSLPLALDLAHFFKLPVEEIFG